MKDFAIGAANTASMPHPGRSIVAALALLLLVIPMASVAGAPVKVRHVTFEAAEATWFLKRRGDVYIYYVIAYRISKPGAAARTRLFVDKSKCRLDGAKRKKLASCTLEGRVEKLKPRSLRMQPLLNGARLRFRDHRIVWEGTGSMEPDVDPFVDPEAVFADAYFERPSTARGRLYGTRMPKKGLEHAGLSYGADAAIITSPDELPPSLRFEVRAVVTTR